MNSNDPNCIKTGHSPRHRHWKSCTQKFYLPWPNISTNLYVYTYIHQSIQIRMPETQTGMAPFFKTDGCFTLTLTVWPIERSHHPIIQTDPKHSPTKAQELCDQSLFWPVNIAGQCLWKTILIGDQYLFWWMLVINPGVHIRSNLPPGKCKLTVCHRKSLCCVYINLGKSSTNRQFPIAMSNYQRLSVFVFPPLVTFGAAARAMSFRIDSAACKHKPFERGEVLDHHHSSIHKTSNGAF